jgi:tRNA dimethylallyltransferase
MDRENSTDSIYWLCDKLKMLDPLSAERIDPRNRRRVIRAMEVILTTGRPFSDQRARSESAYELIMIGLQRSRPSLYDRVDARIESMFANGFVDEVKSLLTKGYAADLPTMSAIGYRECAAVIEGRMTLDEAKMQMKKLTRIFVRRQANWFKESDPSIKWFAMNEHVTDEIILFIKESLQ